MKCTHQILVSEFFPGNSLVTREVASLLIDRIETMPYRDVIVDFSNIQFISRSFADQFHKEKIRLWENGQKELVVENAEHDVFEMLKAVSKTQNVKDRNYSFYPSIHFQSRRSLKEYLEYI